MNDSIEGLQIKYFQDILEIAINSLTKNPEYPPCCLDDPVFINFFNDFYQKHQFTEYYLLEATGSYLFLDEKANPSLLIVQDEMESAYYNAELGDIEVPANIREALKARKMLLHRYTNNDFTKQISDWESSVHSATKLEGRNNYYYAYIADSSKCPVDVERIVSYKIYLQHLK